MEVLRIGITQRDVAAGPRSSARDALDRAWYPWLLRECAGARFLPIPNFDDSEVLRGFVDGWALNALILSSGEDIGHSTLRDHQELQLCRWAEREGWPVLGVCRGMQMLHHYSGGRLQPIDDHCAGSHRVDSIGATAQVNSWHRWSVSEPSAQWEILARAEDGTIEAMRHRQHPWLALMWHPEREHDGAALWRDWWRHAVRRSQAIRA